MGPKYNHKGPYKKESRRSKPGEDDRITEARLDRATGAQAWPECLEAKRSKGHILPQTIQKEPTLLTT